jgi:hypothetical protein
MKLSKLCSRVDDSAQTLRSLKPSFKLFGLRQVELNDVMLSALQDVVEELNNQLDVLDAFYEFIEEHYGKHPQMTDKEIALAHKKQAQLLRLSGEVECVIYNTVFSNKIFQTYKPAPRVPKWTRKEPYWIQWRHIEGLLKVYDHLFQIDVPVL